jgi:hypothetical protein
MAGHHLAVVLNRGSTKVPKTHHEMGKVGCACGVQYGIFHSPAYKDARRAKEQRTELRARLIQDHVQFRNHERLVQFD